MPNTQPWQPLPPFVQDQLLGVNALNVIATNQAFLYNRMKRTHFMVTKNYGYQLVGEHNDYHVARCNAIIKYNGTFGAGGAWTIAASGNAHGLTVANQNPDVAGRGLVSFALYIVAVASMADALYSVFAKPFFTAAPAARPSEVLPYGRTANNFSFSYRVNTGGSAWAEQSNNGNMVSVEVHGNVPII